MLARVGSGNFGVGSWIERRARTAPDHVALIAGDRSSTYEELAGRVRRLANGLRRLGVERGHRVAWLGPNHPAFVESLFAAGLLGAALAPVNHRLEATEILSVLEDTEPSVLIQYHATDLMAVPSSVGYRIAVADSLDGALDFEALLAESLDDSVEEPVGPDDLCLLPHTSGTTGRPKGVMLTHGNVTWNVINLLSCADFRSDDVTIAIAPFFRVGGTGVNVLPVLFVGGTVVVPDEVAADPILRLIEQYRVSVGSATPTSWTAWSGPGSGRPPTCRASASCSPASVPERLIRAYLDRGVVLLQGYGLSEAAPLALLLDPESALEKIGSAGRPPLLVDVRIVGADGSDVASGETGELLVRGPNIMAGYWNQPKATREVLTSDGWLRTGDAARIDDEGFVWIVDRVGDRFTSDGLAVYPGDIERVLIGHPAVADVGVADLPAEGKDEAGVAFVVLSAAAGATEEELLAFCRQRLAPHQVPASVTFVERLPRNSVGKLIRAQLRALASRDSADRRAQPTA
jgi:acyl-CoA synthetase (AMP-forming)/AMP-acid ligase II